jgi:UDP-2,3-diacylglucosamine pyrophosphatase LpxH
MVKIALITDTHWGTRGDSVYFHDNSKLFCDKVFFPYLQDKGINHIIHLGDLVERRKYINYNTATRLRSDFLDVLASKHYMVYFITGNHDAFNKNTNKINSLRELIDGKYSNFYIIDMDAQEIEIDIRLLLIPWICDENKERIFDSIKKTKAQIAFGHLELYGFEMLKGVMSTTGLNHQTFKKFDMVFSGHFHHKSIQENIYYLGAHAEFTWADYNDSRGFHVFDTETRNLTFIENPYKMFRKIIYDEDNMDNEDFFQYQTSMVKVIIKKKTNNFLFEKFIDNIERQNPINLQVVEDSGIFSSSIKEIDETVSTLDICMSYIDGIDLASSSVNKNKLKNTIKEIYNEALSTG